MAMMEEAVSAGDLNVGIIALAMNVVVLINRAARLAAAHDATRASLGSRR
jgi:hypothetical protein